VTSSRSLVRAIPITIVLAIVAFGLLLIALAHWRRGTAALAFAMLLAGLLRVVLSERVIGVLAVRGKGFDVAFYAVVGAFMLALAIGVP
jgi:Na+/proline symporter